MNFNLQEPENKIIENLSKLDLDDIKKICDKNKHILDICKNNHTKLFTMFYKHKGYKSLVDDFARNEKLLVQFYKIDPTFANNHQNLIESYTRKQKRITTFLLANQPETNLINNLSTKFSDRDIAKTISKSQDPSYITEIIRYNLTRHNFDDALLLDLLNKSKYMINKKHILHKDWKKNLRDDISNKLSAHISKEDFKQSDILELFVSAITNKWSSWTDDWLGYNKIAAILYSM